MSKGDNKGGCFKTVAGTILAGVVAVFGGLTRGCHGRVPSGAVEEAAEAIHLPIRGAAAEVFESSSIVRPLARNVEGEGVSIRPPGAALSGLPEAVDVGAAGVGQKVASAEARALEDVGPKVARIEEQTANRAWGEAEQSVRDALLVAALSAEARRTLPAVGKQTAALAGLADVRALIVQSWDHPPDVAALRRLVDGVARAEADDALAEKVRMYLICRAYLDGAPESARGLAKAGESAPDAKKLLRDLKLVGSDAAAATLDPPAPLLGPLPAPEAPAAGFRPGVRESLHADLPEMEELVSAEKAARTRMLRDLEDRAQNHWHRLRLSLHEVQASIHAAQGRPDRKEDGDANEPRTAEVTKLLGRAATPAERLLIARLRETKTAEETATILRGPDAAKP